MPETRVNPMKCDGPSQFICDHVEIAVGWECPRCGLTADAECDYGGWHSEDQLKWMDATEIRELLARPTLTADELRRRANGTV